MLALFAFSLVALLVASLLAFVLASFLASLTLDGGLGLAAILGAVVGAILAVASAGWLLQAVMAKAKAMAAIAVNRTFFIFLMF